ncbi:MAG: phosphopantetheine-binding protein, partial [Candidatus Microthrix subdominans]
VDQMEAAVPAETHMERQSLDRDAVLQLVKEQLADIMESDVDAIGEDDRFAEDLHTDSLALVELVEVLEDELAERSCAVLFDDEDLVDLLTVRDAVDYVMARMGS